MKKTSLIRACAIALTLLPVSSYARQWTLQDCISYALQHNISLQKTRLQRLSAVEDVRESQAALLPSLSGTVSQNVSYNPWPQSGSYTITGSRVQTQVDKKSGRLLTVRRQPTAFRSRLHSCLFKFFIRKRPYR